MVDTWTGPKSGARYNEYLASQKYGQTYVPGQGAGTALKQYTTAQEEAAKTAQAKTDATRLEEINKRLAPIYNPLTELIGTQKKAAEARYATNQADIKNIFGALTKVADADRIRIDKQFTDSIAKQQMDLAARTAQQRSETAAGVAQAEATGAERGAGPEMAVNPISVAAEEGISNANAIMSNWQGLMQANQAQAQIDVNARGAGYGQQQVGALAALSKNFEDTMSNLGTQEAQLKSQIAAATAAAQEAYRQGDAAAAAAAEEAANAYKMQLLKNEGAQNVANTQAQARLQGIQMQQTGANNRAAASGSTATEKQGKGVAGIINLLASKVGPQIAGVFQDRLNKVLATNPKSSSEAISRFMRDAGLSSADPKVRLAVTGAAADVFNSLDYNAKATITLPGVTAP